MFLRNARSQITSKRRSAHLRLASRVSALQHRWSDTPEARRSKADARRKGAIQATDRAGCVRCTYRLPPLLPTRLRLDGLTRSACPPPSTRATSCPGSGRADDLREKLTGQGPRPRLVGEALHLPGERRHGRSAPLTLHEQETLWLGCGGLLFPRTPAARRGTPGGPPEALLTDLSGLA